MVIVPLGRRAVYQEFGKRSRGQEIPSGHRDGRWEPGSAMVGLDEAGRSGQAGSVTDDQSEKYWKVLHG